MVAYNIVIYCNYNTMYSYFPALTIDSACISVNMINKSQRQQLCMKTFIIG